MKSDEQEFKFLNLALEYGYKRSDGANQMDGTGVALSDWRMKPNRLGK